MDEFKEQLIIKKSDQLHHEIRTCICELVKISTSSSTSAVDIIPLTNKLTVRIVNFINEFEPRPKLLEAHLAEYIESLTNLYLSSKYPIIKSSIGEIVYNFAKIRQFKQVALYFSSDLYIINKLIRLSSELTNEFEIFLCLIWLCNLVLVPFNFNNIDPDLLNKLYEIGQRNLRKYNNGSKNQVISLILLSRLLSRGDCQALLDKYFEHTKVNWLNESDTSKLGYYLCINKLLKRKQLCEEQLSVIYHLIIDDLLFSPSHQSVLNILYLIKILSKLAIYYIKTGSYPQVQDIVNNLINDIMNNMINQFDTNLRYAFAKSLSAIIKQLSFSATNYQDQLIKYVIDQLELPQNYDDINIAKTHSILLTLGYITLTKSLPERYVSQLLDICHYCLFIKIRRLSFNLGTQLRDSSTFIIWTICRTTKSPPPSKIVGIFLDLLRVLVFDQDLTLKRCSIAVLQELLGRFGNIIVPIGDDHTRGETIIGIMEVFNELSLVNKTVSYQVIDLLYSKIDLSFLIEGLVDHISEYDGNGKYLCKLLQQPRELELSPRQEYDIGTITNKLVRANRWHILFDFPEVPTELLHSTFANFTYSETKEAMILGYLKFLISYKFPTDSDWDNLFKIMNKSEYTSEFQVLFSKLDTIPEDSLFDHVQFSSTLSNCLFNYRHFSQVELSMIVKIMRNEKIDAEIRSNLINNLSDNFQFHNLNVASLYDLFDDYTTTEQGDVGSKIRLAMIRLVGNNIEYFFGNDMIKLKLIRLSGELMDRIRHRLFELLHLLDRDTIDEISLKDHYWSELFNYYGELQEGREREEFWKGLVFSVGSFTGNQQIINDAFNELLRFQPNLDDFRILTSFLKLDKNSPSRTLKCISMTLNLFLKLLTANFRFPSGIDYNGLFIKCYNLHINTGNLTRVTTVLRIFYYLSKVDTSLKQKIYDRLFWLLTKHKSPKIKILVGQEVLFEIVNDLQDLEALSRYDEINWDELSEEDIVFIKSILH